MIFCKILTILYYLSGTGNIKIVSNTTNVAPPPLNCGKDKSPIKVVYEGYGKIETYPWLGVLYYPSDDSRYTTSVVLVTPQIVIGSAMDVDKIPKHDFRTRSRIILGIKCTSEGIKVRDYSYHPDFSTSTHSAPALIQLQTNRMRDLQPICAPPPRLPPPPGVRDGPAFYAVPSMVDAVLHIENCQKSTIKIYKMAYVDPEQCKTFYIKSGLDIEKIWATHTVCAKSLTGLQCIWRNGAVLAMRQNDRWHLVGFGIYGPGCRAPARFLDYAQYRPWVSSSVARIGRPTVTRIANNKIILRRSLSSVQRYGPCEPEEIRFELFTDRTTIERGPTAKSQHASYNFTIFANLEYSCIVFRVFYHKRARIVKEVPLIRLHRWCTAPRPICYSFQFLQIDFAVEIFFKGAVTYKVSAYGREVRLIDMKKVMGRVNQKKDLPVVVMGADE